MSTLAVVEVILRETQVPMSVRQIVEYAGSRLPTKSRTPDTVVARDLSMDIKRKGEASLFIRTSPGRYTLRELCANMPAAEQSQGPSATQQTEPLAEPLAQRLEELPAEQAMEAAPTAPTAPTAMDAPPTSVLASAMKAERAAALPAKKLPAADEQTGTLR